MATRFLSKFKTGLLEGNLIGDSMWALVGSLAAKGLSFIAAIIVAKYLGKELFGEYALVKNSLQSFAILSSFGVGYTATKIIAERQRKSKREVMLATTNSYIITLTFSLLCALLIFILSDTVARHVFQVPGLAPSLRIASFGVVFSAMTTTQTGIIAGLGTFRDMAKLNVIAGAVTFITSVLLVFYWGISGAILSLVLSQVIVFVAYERSIRKTIGKCANDCFEFSRIISLIKLSLPVALQEMLFFFF